MKRIDDKYFSSRLPIIYNGKLCDLMGYGEGKTIHLRVIRNEDKDKCPYCDKPIPTDYSVLEHSPNFQSGAVLLKEIK